MSSTIVHREGSPAPAVSRRLRTERVVDWTASAGLFALVGTTLLGLAAGSIIAVIWRPEVDWQAYNWPFIAQSMGYVLAIALGVPSLLAGGWDLLHGRWSRGAARLLAFVGPVVILLGVGEGSHLLIRCDITPFICQDGDIYDRWHQLHHTVVAGVPLLLLYALVRT